MLLENTCSLLAHLGNILNGWWLVIAWLAGLYSVLLVNPALQKKGLHREAVIAFFGGWFWLVFGLVGFVAGKIFVRYF